MILNNFSCFHGRYPYCTIARVFRRWRRTRERSARSRLRAHGLVRTRQRACVASERGTKCGHNWDWCSPGSKKVPPPLPPSLSLLSLTNPIITYRWYIAHISSLCNNLLHLLFFATFIFFYFDFFWIHSLNSCFLFIYYLLLLLIINKIRNTLKGCAIDLGYLETTFTDFSHL